MSRHVQEWREDRDLLRYSCTALLLNVALLDCSALRMWAHSMWGVSGYYRTNIENPLNSSSPLPVENQEWWWGDLPPPSITHGRPYGQNTLIFVTTCPSPSPPLNTTLHWVSLSYSPRRFCALSPSATYSSAIQWSHEGHATALIVKRWWAPVPEREREQAPDNLQHAPTMGWACST